MPKLTPEEWAALRDRVWEDIEDWKREKREACGEFDGQEEGEEDDDDTV